MAYELATAPKSIKSAANSHAAARTKKATNKLRVQQKVSAPLIGGGVSLVLGLAERFVLPAGAQIGPIDNGITVGIPFILGGILTSGNAGLYLLEAGIGPFCSGVRNMAKTLGAGPTTAGDFDDVAGAEGYTNVANEG